MINAIINGFLKLITGLVDLLLHPIDMFIVNNLPSFSSAISSVVALFTLITQGIDWAIDSFCIPDYAITFMILTLGFRLYLRLNIAGVKLALNWYEKLIP